MAHALSLRFSRLAISSRRSRSTVATIASTPGPISKLFRPFQTAMDQGMRCLSTLMPLKQIESAGARDDWGATKALGPLPSQDDAENFAAFAHANNHRKVKPFIFKRRVQKLRTFSGFERDIRHSPWRMNLVCEFAAGLTVPEALKQLMFCRKSRAPLLAMVIRRTALMADEKDGIQPSQLEVAECFATHGRHLKRLKIMGRGRSGIKRRRHSHIRLVLREIDFPTKLVRAESVNQKRKWLGLLRIAREDFEQASVQQKELEELEAMAAKLEEDARKKKEEEQKKLE